ncbi:putative RNA-directed DNA polymerase [Helianthus annuus]|nr:putative RNA-directed DNA polymerase [Helianthus annuus]
MNIKGAGGAGKAAKVRGILVKYNLSFLAIQETQFRDLPLNKIRKFWDNTGFEYSKVDADGRSGGLLSLWNPCMFKKELEIKNQNFIILKGRITGEEEDLVIVNIYGSTLKSNRRRMWDELLTAKNSIDGSWIMLGDFNEVRFPEERFNSHFDISGAMYFNSFISSGDFMGKWPNASLTALNRDISDHSPLVLTTVNNSFGPSPFRLFNSWFGIEGFDEVIKRGLGRICESRFKDEVLAEKLKAIKEEIKLWRKNKKDEEERDLIEARNSLKLLDDEVENRQLTESELSTWHECKRKIKEWNDKVAADMQQKARSRWVELGDENTAFFHTIVNNHIARNKICGLWLDGEWVTDPVVIKNQFLSAFHTKFKEPVCSRPRIGAEGFKKLSSTEADGLICPFSLDEVRNAIWSCGINKSPGPDGITFKLIKTYWEELKGLIMEVMHQFFIHGSIHPSCSASFIALIPKVHDPITLSDFRPISLVGVVNKIISKVLANRMKGVLKCVVSSVQSAFISDRNIIDGPLIINEVVGWAKKSGKNLFVFKADIEKAYDTLNWKFLISVLTHMGFPAKWRNWVMGILFAGRGSILVNGSPTGEFHYKRGLRQGDPLSPFLFIVAMEGLHVMMERAKQCNIFSGVKLPRNGPCITHMLYADDSIFIGEWEGNNVKNLKRILRIFYLISGLKVNPRKSQIFGVGINEEEVQNMASIFNCKVGKFPFVYLGLKVGASMNRIANWREVIDMFNKRLTSWKAKTLSFAGRVVLIKAVLGCVPNYYLSLYKCPEGVIRILEGIRRKFLWGGCSANNKLRWVKWEKVVAAEDFGGLGIGNIKDTNLALLSKWWWRLKMEPENLWVRIVKSLHTNNRKAQPFPFKKSLPGVWKSIGDIDKDFMKSNINITTNIRSRVGIGDKTLFWIDIWAGDVPLKDQFPLLFQLSTKKMATVMECYSIVNGGKLWNWSWGRAPASIEEKQEMVSLNNQLQNQVMSQTGDVWYWKNFENQEFSVKNVKQTLGQNLDLNVPPSMFCWNNWVTSKCTTFVWRAVDEKIPTLLALRNRGMNFPNVTCKTCGAGDESAHHILIECNFAKRVWEMISKWLRIPMVNPELNLKETLAEIIEVQRSRNIRKLIHAAVIQTLWMLWKTRNERVFSGRQGVVQTIVEEIKEASFQGVKHRSKHRTISRQEWWDFNLNL